MGAQKKSRKPEERTARAHQILKILHKWGIHTLGQLARLDKEKLAARLGPDALLLWERAQGKSTRILKWVQPPESLVESFEFEHEVETIEPLLFILRRFLEQLSLRLHGVYLVSKELTLRIGFNNRQEYERRFKIPQPTNEVDLLFRMLHAHLENFKSEYPIVAVSLEAEAGRAAQQQFGLFETALRDPNQLYETLARLTGLLGPERVGTPLLEETHRPDSFRMEPFSWQLAGSSEETVKEKPDPAPAALRRFRPALAASVLLEKNRPVHVRSPEISGAAVEQSGPYLASGNWWDEKEWTRREWDLNLAEGAILRCHENGCGWQIDGIYD
jgi:protein ImuB